MLNISLLATVGFAVVGAQVHKLHTLRATHVGSPCENLWKCYGRFFNLAALKPSFRLKYTMQCRFYARFTHATQATQSQKHASQEKYNNVLI